MNTELLISCDDWENRVAVLEEGSLAEIYFEREEKVIGSIYKGRVENVLPGMGACFVNIGLGRNAFLYVDDIRRDPINIGETEITDRRKGHTVNELLKVGDDVLVQIVKEPRGLKGARVSTNISLPGRYLVLMPTGRYSGVSSRIDDDKERDRLKQVMRRVRPEGMATIVRTAARGVSEAELIADLGVQLRLWHGILESYKRSTAPALLHKDLNLVFKAVRDFMTSDVRHVVIDSKEQFDEIRSTMSLLGPQYLSRLKLWEGPGDLFEVRGIDEELQKLLKPKIVLPSGGYLILEHTEALTVIDVNTGKFTGGRNLEDTLVRTNIEAAAEIARQVRLRDIGGIIVVDFIDMAHERSRQQVIDTLGEALKRDRTRSTIQAFSNLGLLEFTRKRVGKDLAGQLRSDCPYCTGLGDVMSSESLAIALLRKIRQRGQNGSRGKKLDLVVDPSVATQLVGWYHEEVEKLARTLGIEVQLFVDAQRHRESITLENAHRTRKPLSVGRELEVDLLPVRLPDPGSGVAVYDSNIIEVKDAANGTGTLAKIKVTAADGDLARAELVEPLQSGQRRRRRGRGRGKAAVETEAPIAPPVPQRAPSPEREAARSGRDRDREETAARSTARRREIPPLAYGVDEEDEEDYTLRGGRVAGGSVGAGSVGRAPAAEGRPREDVRSGRGRTRGGRGRDRDKAGGRTPQYPQPMIVGGEGDIDYEDDEDSVLVVPDKGRGVAAPARVSAQALPADRTGAQEDEQAALRRRRRRRGRGRGAEDEGTSPASEGRQDYGDDDAAVASAARRRPSAQPDRARRETRDVREREDHDDRDERVQPRPARRFGPIQQLYGRPMEIVDDEEPQAPRRLHEERPLRDERHPREERPLRDERHPRAERPLRDERHPRAERPLRDERHPRAERPLRDERHPREERPLRDERHPRATRPAPPRVADVHEDDLDVVIEPAGPKVLDVEIAPAPGRPRMQRPAAAEREARDERPSRRPRQEGDRERDRDRDRGGPPRRGGRMDRDRSGSSEPRVPRQVKQVYPPPGAEERPPVEGAPKALPFASRRTPRGPMMRDPKAEPPPKGKVRQLYPPPEFDEEYVEENSSVAPSREREPERASQESMFVSGAEELDERRRHARERADARRGDGDAGEPSDAPLIRPPFGGAFDVDEES